MAFNRFKADRRAKPKLSLADFRFPLEGGRAKLDLTVMPAASGGLIYSQRLRDARAEVFTGIKDKPKGVTRFRFSGAFGRAQKDFLVHDDWVRLGDRLYRRVREPQG